MTHQFQERSDESQVTKLRQVVYEAQSRFVEGDFGAPFEPLALQSLVSVEKESFAEFQRLRTTLISSGVSARQLDRALKQHAADTKASQTSTEVHPGMAKE